MTGPRPVAGRPVAVGGPRFGSPVTVSGGTVAVADPAPPPVQQGDEPVRVGDWQQTEEPRTLPVGGGTRPVLEGEGPPPDYVPGVEAGDYYLDRTSGYLSRYVGPGVPGGRWVTVALLKGPPGPTGRGIAAAEVVDGKLVLTLSDGVRIDAGGVLGPPGADGRSVAIEGSVPTAADLPVLGPEDTGTGYITVDTGNLHVWDGDSFLDVGPVRGPRGEDGAPGPTGPRGTKWFNGFGPPPAVVPGAQDGDYYLDVDSGIAWQVQP